MSVTIAAERSDQRMPTKFSHRPPLDGLRAIAALLVVSFHADVPFLNNGYAGVDVFFVLSGFLITSLLAREFEARRRLDIVGFYARRARRLLPASLLVLLVTGVLFQWLASPLAVAEARGGFIAAALYVSNWYFLDQSQDYFAESIDPSPVLHYWSLSVEEQFYLAWPLILVALAAAVRYRPTRLIPVVSFLAVLGAVFSGWVATSAPMESYFGTVARSYQLLVGATVALMVLRRERFGDPATRDAAAWRGWVAPVGLVLLLVAVSPLQGDASPYARGVTSCVATALLIFGLEMRPGGSLASQLSKSIPRRLGLYSYAIYLWHWPVVVIGDLAGALPTSWLPRAILVIALSIGLSAASYHLVERRFFAISLTTIKSRRRVALAGPVAAVATAAALFAIMPVSASTKALIDEVTVDQPDAQKLEREEAGASGSDVPSVVLIGDSHAGFWSKALGEQAEERGFHLSTLYNNGCPWPVVESFNRDGSSGDCEAELRGPALEELRKRRADLAILISRSIVIRPIETPTGIVEPGDPGWLEVAEEGSRQFLEDVSRLADNVVVLEPIPMVRPPMVDCLSTGVDPAECNAPADELPGTAEIEATWQEVASDLPNVTVLDIDDLVCPDGTCPAMSDGHITFRDDNHLSDDYATQLAPAVLEELQAQGVPSVGKR